MTVSLLKGMRVQLKVKEGEGPWFDVLAINGPLPLEQKDSFADKFTWGHFLIFDPDAEPTLRWLTPSQIKNVEYELAYGKAPARPAGAEPMRAKFIG